MSEIRGMERALDYRDQIMAFLLEQVDPEFDPAIDRLIDTIDSVTLLQLVMRLEEAGGVSIDLSSLSIEMFTSVDTLAAALSGIASTPEA